MLAGGVACACLLDVRAGRCEADGGENAPVRLLKTAGQEGNSTAEHRAEAEMISSGREWTASRRLPHALIVGVKKGGTRALLEFIRLHPDIRALGSEPHFFVRHYGRGLSWYRSKECVRERERREKLVGKDVYSRALYTYKTDDMT